MHFAVCEFTSPITLRCPLSCSVTVRLTPPVPLTVKFVVLVAVPPGVVTVILPVVAPVGTVAVICVGELTVKVVAATPLNFTDVAPVKFVPVITTDVPTAPLVGVNELIVGTAFTVKLIALEPQPVAFRTRIGPLVAPAGTTTLRLVAVGVPVGTVWAVPNRTAVTPLRFVPVSVTVVPIVPELGDTLVIVGQFAADPPMVKLGPATPPGVVVVVTVTAPVVAPEGTVTVSWVVESAVNVPAGAAVPLNDTPVTPVKSVPVMMT